MCITDRQDKTLAVKVALNCNTTNLVMQSITYRTWDQGVTGSNPLLVEPHSTVGSVVDLRTGGCWFDPWLSQYSFRGLMIVIATGFIPLSQQSVVSTMVKWESSQWLGKNIVQSTGKRNSGKAWIGVLTAVIYLKYCWKWHQTPYNQSIYQLNSLLNFLPHNPNFLTTLRKKPFENIVGKGKNAVNQHFLLFPLGFLTIQKKICF